MLSKDKGEKGEGLFPVDNFTFWGEWGGRDKGEKGEGVFPVDNFTLSTHLRGE